MMQAALDILKKYWNYDAFRSPQESIIQHVLDGKDILALMPTGGGKSICFQVPTMMRDGLCIVITPLIALMKDQVFQLKKRNIKAAAIFSGLSYREIDTILDNAVFGYYKFLYVSPERLKTELFIERFKVMPIQLIAVDEAHCISQWGYDFRPPYLEIAAIRQYHLHVPILALTASATPEVQLDIQEKLLFKNQSVFKKSFST
jgi:ATP-dependent DNA helicase RecQ